MSSNVNVGTPGHPDWGTSISETLMDIREYEASLKPSNFKPNITMPNSMANALPDDYIKELEKLPEKERRRFLEGTFTVEEPES